ncbi:MAG: branched-chain amino acid ABC transporter substrate-binding protein [Elusimicrobiota bacterium]|nr:branched-chain amino acid ABC transporter substrate-binding protein [Elusimicrobiota bacterium]
MSLTRRAGLALSAAILALAAGCGPKEQVVKIAVAVPLTGDMGTEGQGLRRAVELAVEEANAAKRFPYKLVAAPYDDRADPKEAVNVANLIVSDPRVVAVVGHYNSGCAIPAAKVYARAPVAMVSPAATNPEVTAQQLTSDWQGPKMVFRVCPTDDVQGSYAAEFAFKKLGKRRMALLHDKSPYGQGLAEQFAKTFGGLGGKVVSEDGVSVGDKDFKALLTKLQGDKNKPEGVYFGGLYTEAGLLLKQMKELGMKLPFAFISGDGSKTSGLFDVAGESADGAYLSIVGIPVEDLPSAKTFMDNYKKRFTGAGEELKPFDHFGYEAAQIIMAAMERAGGHDRVKVIEELRKTDYTGVLGKTTFDEKGDTLNKIVTMTQAQGKDKVFTTVK